MTPLVRAVFTRMVAISIASLVIAVGVPTQASAADDFWGLWASELTQRAWWEVPFATVASLPAMIVVTPFWASGKAIGAIRNRGKD